MDSIFNPASTLPPNLVPNPPSEMPGPQDVGDATAHMSPFTEPQDVASIIGKLKLDTPLKLQIPDKHLMPGYEFRIINSIPQEIAAAHNKGFREVTAPSVIAHFADLVAGTTKEGQAFRPILCARPKAVGEHVREQQRLQLRSLYAGMDPKNKEMGGKYTSGVDAKDGTFLNRSGAPWSIRVKK